MTPCSPGFLHSCFVMGREKENEMSLFGDGRQQVTACLDGYAIVPLEHYNELRTAAGLEEIKIPK